MTEHAQFKFDVFISYSSRDKAIVHPIAERLKDDGLRVWLDDWEIKPGDNIPHKIEEGLEHSGVLVFCMSANAFGSDWTALESQTFRFRDPLNKKRRFIPLRLDNTPIKGSLNQFLYINWNTPDKQQEYTKLIESFQPPEDLDYIDLNSVSYDERFSKVTHLDIKVKSFNFSSDGLYGLSGDYNNTLQLWDINNGKCISIPCNGTA